MSFEIDIPYFHGPFDLLLFFIERDELDIRDIPIAKITDDFLAYVRNMEKREMEVASEFILVAATLMQIKAHMLLPRAVLDDQGNEVDPREELIQHLMEYKKYKSVVNTFIALEEQRQLLEKRGNILNEVRAISAQNDVETELQDIDLYKLLKVYARTMQRFETEKQKPTHTVVPYPYTIEQQKQYLRQRISDAGRLAFTEIILEQPDRIAVIFNFLSILEMLQARQLSIVVGDGFNNFWLEMTGNEERVEHIL